MSVGERELADLRAAGERSPLALHALSLGSASPPAGLVGFGNGRAGALRSSQTRPVTPAASPPASVSSASLVVSLAPRPGFERGQTDDAPKEHAVKNIDKQTIALRCRLANIKDELELFGWRPEDTSRYMRDALKVLALDKVVKLFEEMVAEERAYYSQHAPLADDQLDHTLIAA